MMKKLITMFFVFLLSISVVLATNDLTLTYDNTDGNSVKNVEAIAYRCQENGGQTSTCEEIDGTYTDYADSGSSDSLTLEFPATDDDGEWFIVYSFQENYVPHYGTNYFQGDNAVDQDGNPPQDHYTLNKQTSWNGEVNDIVVEDNNNDGKIMQGEDILISGELYLDYPILTDAYLVGYDNYETSAFGHHYEYHTEVWIVIEDPNGNYAVHGKEPWSVHWYYHEMIVNTNVGFPISGSVFDAGKKIELGNQASKLDKKDLSISDIVGNMRGVPKSSYSDHFTTNPIPNHEEQVTFEFTPLVAGTHTATIYTKCLDSKCDTEETSVDEIEFEVLESDENQAPIAIIDGPTSGETGETLEYDGSQSYDNDGTIVSYEWDFESDGIVDSTDVDPSISFASAGTYYVTLTVTDDEGATGFDLAVVEITEGTPNVDPVADPNGPYYGVVGEVITFDGTGSYDTDGTITYSSWGFGDGNYAWSDLEPTNSYSAAGTYTVTLCVMDDDYGYDCEDTEAIITESAMYAPNAIARGPDLVEVGEEVEYDGSWSYDPDNQALTYEWDFDGDGVTDSNDIYPLVTFNSVGTYIVTLRVTDTDGLYDEDSIEVTAVDDLEELNPTPDNGRDQYFIDTIQFRDSEVVEAGSYLEIYVSAENIGGRDKDDVMVSAIIPELQTFAKSPQYSLDDGEENGVYLYLWIPEGTAPGYYTVRMTLSDDTTKRIRHRDVIVTE